MNSNRAFIAYHEAGHVVADIVFGHDTGPLTIGQDGDAADRRSSLLDSISADEDEKAYQVIFERFIMSALAGWSRTVAIRSGVSQACPLREPGSPMGRDRSRRTRYADT